MVVLKVVNLVDLLNELKVLYLDSKAEMLEYLLVVSKAELELQEDMKVVLKDDLKVVEKEYSKVELLDDMKVG
jgi:hypothetical protein